MTFKRLVDVDVRDKRVFIRSDLNVPQDDAGHITDDTRIRASVPGIRDALSRGAAVMVTSHLGRPTEGQWTPGDSLAPIACAGPLIAGELDALGKALLNPKRPLVAIVGGAKVSTKLTVLRALAAKVDTLIVGGGIANTFILAAGGKIGKSLAELDLVAEAKSILAEFPGKVPIPIDAVCAKEFSANAKPELKAIENIAPDDLILDVGPQSVAALKMIVARAGTIVWNGPIGVFEFDAFAKGT